jgi:hypothetical protein
MTKPESVIPQACPTGIINKMVPHAASPKPIVILISGIRLAQLEKQIPVQKYRQKIAKRILPFDTTPCFIILSINLNNHKRFLFKNVL